MGKNSAGLYIELTGKKETVVDLSEVESSNLEFSWDADLRQE